MSFSNRLQKVIKQAFTDVTASSEFIDILGNSAGSMIAAGTFTTAGGDVTETIPVVGAVAGDVVTVSIQAVGAVPVTIVAAIATTDAITVTLSANPSTDHVLAYSVFRVSA